MQIIASWVQAIPVQLLTRIWRIFPGLWIECTVWIYTCVYTYLSGALVHSQSECTYCVTFERVQVLRKYTGVVEMDTMPELKCCICVKLFQRFLELFADGCIIPLSPQLHPCQHHAKADLFIDLKTGRRKGLFLPLGGRDGGPRHHNCSHQYTHPVKDRHDVENRYHHLSFVTVFPHVLKQREEAKSPLDPGQIPKDRRGQSDWATLKHARGWPIWTLSQLVSTPSKLPHVILASESADSVTARLYLPLS